MGIKLILTQPNAYRLIGILQNVKDKTILEAMRENKSKKPTVGEQEQIDFCDQLVLQLTEALQNTP